MSDAPLSISVDTSGLVGAERQADRTSAALLKVADATDKVEKTSESAAQKTRFHHGQYAIMADAAEKAARASNQLANTAPGMRVLSDAIDAAAGRMVQGASTAQRLGEALRGLGGAAGGAAGAIGGGGGGGGAVLGGAGGGGGIGASLAAALTSSTGIMVGATVAVGALAVAYGALVVRANAVAEAHEAEIRRLATLTGSREQAKAQYKDIADFASAAGIKISEATEKVIAFARAGEALGGTRTQMLAIAEISEKLGQISGASSSERGSAQGALAKMLADSKVSAGELRSVLSNVPQIAEQIAAGLGVSVNHLKLMAQEGTLTNEAVFGALLKQQKAVNDEFKSMPTTVGRLHQSIANDVGQIAERYAHLIPLVREYQMLTASAAAAARYVNNATTPATPAQKLAGRSPPSPYLGPTGVISGSGSSGYNTGADESYYRDLYDLAGSENGQTFADMQAASKRASVSINDAVSVAAGLDPVSARLKTLDEQAARLNKGLAELNGTMHGLPADVVADRAGRITDALRKIGIEAENTGSAYDKAWKAVVRAEEQSAAGLTPAQRSMADRTKALVDTGSATPAAAADIVDRQQLLTVKELVEAKEREAEKEEALTAAMKRGKAAMMEATMAAALLEWQLRNVGASSEEAEVAMDVLAERFSIASAKITGAQGARAGANAAKPLLDELATIAAGMKVVEQGAYAMRRAEAEARAARATDGTGKLQLQVFDAKQGMADAQMIAGLRVEIDLTNQLAKAAGDVARQKQIQLDADIKRAQQNAAPGSAGTIADTMRQKAEAERARSLAEGSASLEKQIELAKEEAGIIQAGTAEYAVQVAMLQKKRDLIQQGVDIGSPEAQRQIGLSGELARANEQTKIARQAADEQKRIWQNAFDGIQKTGADAFYDIFSGANVTAASVADSFKRIFLRAFAEIAAAAIIRPLISPIVSMGQSAGIVPQGIGGYGGGAGGMSSMGGFGGMGGFELPDFLGGGSISSFMSSTPFASSAPAGGFASIDALMASGQAGASAGWSSGGISGAMSGMTVGNMASGALGIGMGAYQLASGNGSTKSTIGGISSMVGGALMMIPTPWTMAAGAAISLAGNILPGLFGGDAPALPPLSGSNLRFDPGSGGYTMADTNQNGGKSMAGQFGGAGGTLNSLFNSIGGLTDPSLAFGMSVWNNQREGTTSTYLISPTQGSNQQTYNESGDPSKAIDRLIAKVFYDSVQNNAAGGASASLRTALSTKEPTSVADVQRVIGGTKSYDDLIKNADKEITESEKAFKSIADSMAEITAFAQEFGLAVKPLTDITEKKQLKIATDFAEGIQRALDDMVDPNKGILSDLDKQKKKVIDENNYIVGAITGAQDQILKIEELYAKKRAEVVDQANKATEASLSSLREVIKRLTIGDLSLSSPTNLLATTQATYQATIAKASAGDKDAIAALGGDATNYLQTLLGNTGSTAKYFSENEAVRSALQDVVTRFGVGGGGTMSATGAANDRQLSDALAANKILSDKLDRLLNVLTSLGGTALRNSLYPD